MIPVYTKRESEKTISEDDYYALGRKKTSLTKRMLKLLVRIFTI